MGANHLGFKIHSMHATCFLLTMLAGLTGLPSANAGGDCQGPSDDCVAVGHWNVGVLIEYPPCAADLPFSMPNGIFNGMNVRIDKSGRIVVPKPMRDRLGLKPNTEFELIERADGVLLRPVEERPSMLKVEGLWIHQGTAAPDADWSRVLDDLREERVHAVLKG